MKTMKKISLAPRPALRAITGALVIVLIAFVSPVSALSETFEENIDENGWANMRNMGSYSTYYPTFNKLHINSVESFAGLKYVTAIMYEKPHATYVANMPVDGSSAYTSVVAKIDNTVVGEGIVGYSSNLNSNGTWKNTVYYVDFDYFDPKSFSGLKIVDLVWDSNVVPIVMIKTHSGLSGCSAGWESKYARFDGENFVGGTPVGGKISHSYYTKFDWKNTLELESQAGGVNIDLRRFNCPSTIVVTDNVTQNIVYQKTESNDYSGLVRTTSVVIDLVSPSKTYTVRYPTAGPSDPTATVTVYVRNSQTGAAIANSNIVIDALVNGEYYPVANTTEPSGIFTITLQPTGGGQPNPDGYRLIATADGYNNPMPEINFTVTDSKKYIYCYLDPIAGGPENENNTFIDFYVRDLSANPVSGATVKFGKYTLITNSQGYTVFEVNKNATYTYTVSKSGYGSLTGNAVIGANDRYIINTVLGPSVTPTTPTAIPTAAQTGPTPTLTAPTGEPVSNWLEWFAAHFGMILGGGVEIGKIFMWLCFTVPVGVYVGKEAKAGAAGFMAGAGIVTLFFVLIGWVPIWLVVLLALIIGLLYAKVFNTPDNGGGR